jgi:hypothetical protein
MNNIQPDTRDVEIIVIAENARGQVDFLPLRFRLSEKEISDGMQFVSGNAVASRAGLRGIKMLDESSPGFQKLKDAERFSKFFDEATFVLQDALAGREVDQERTIEQVRELYESFGDEKLYMAVSPEGFWSVKTQSWVQNAVEGTFFRNPEVIGKLRASGPVEVAAYPIRVVAQTGMRDLPHASEIVAAAREALRICKMLRKPVDASNSEELLLLQLRAERINVPEHGKILLKPLMESVRLQAAASAEIDLEQTARVVRPASETA